MGVIDEAAGQKKLQGTKTTVTPTAAAVMVGVTAGVAAGVAGATLGVAVAAGAGVAWLTKRILG